MDFHSIYCTQFNKLHRKQWFLDPFAPLAPLGGATGNDRKAAVQYYLETGIYMDEIYTAFVFWLKN